MVALTLALVVRKTAGFVWFDFILNASSGITNHKGTE
jgi:hypothetical protein